MHKGQLRNEANAVLICTRITDGFTLRQIAKELGCDAGAISHWVADVDTFAQRYAHAKMAQADRFADEIVEISDEGTNDWMEREGIAVPDHENIQRSRLRVDTRKWLMAKMAPKKYGERLTQEITGADGGPLQVVTGVPRDDAS